MLKLPSSSVLNPSGRKAPLSWALIRGSRVVADELLFRWYRNGFSNTTLLFYGVRSPPFVRLEIAGQFQGNNHILEFN